MERVLEPEVMDTAEEASEYDSMDHTEPNATFIARLAIGNTAPFVALFWGVLALTIGVALLHKRNSGTRAAEPVLVPAE